MPLIPLLGVLYAIAGLVGLGALLFAEPVRWLPLLSDRRLLFVVASGFAVLIVVGVLMFIGEGRTRGNDKKRRR